MPCRELRRGAACELSLRHIYPKEYMAALLSSVLDSSDKVGEYFAECRECGIQLLSLIHI